MIACCYTNCSWSFNQNNQMDIVTQTGEIIGIYTLTNDGSFTIQYTTKNGSIMKQNILIYHCFQKKTGTIESEINATDSDAWTEYWLQVYDNKEGKSAFTRPLELHYIKTIKNDIDDVKLTPGIKTYKSLTAPLLKNRMYILNFFMIIFSLPIIGFVWICVMIGTNLKKYQEQRSLPRSHILGENDDVPDVSSSIGSNQDEDDDKDKAFFF